VLGSDESSKTISQEETFSLFTTLRFTSPNPSYPTIPLTEEHIPLLRRHIARLREAHDHFRTRDGKSIWGEWIGDERVWQGVKDKLERNERVGQGDWRVSEPALLTLISKVRILIHRGGSLEVQTIPAPSEAGKLSNINPPVLALFKYT
jgi:hypothetical protein